MCVHFRLSICHFSVAPGSHRHLTKGVGTKRVEYSRRKGWGFAGGSILHYYDSNIATTTVTIVAQIDFMTKLLHFASINLRITAEKEECWKIERLFCSSLYNSLPEFRACF